MSHSARLGGAELCLAEGVRALSERGHDVHVVVPQPGPLVEVIEPWARCHVCHSNPWATPEPRFADTVRWTAYNVRRAVPELVKLLRSITPAVAVTNTITVPAAAVAARFANVPHVWFAHEFGMRDRGLAFVFGERQSVRLMDALSSVFLVNSEALRRHYSPRITRTEIRIIPYAVEIDGDSEPRSTNGPLRLVLVGEKIPAKGQREAVLAVAEAAADGRDIHLDLVGAGDPAYESELRALIDERGLGASVQLVPFTTDPHEYVRAAHAALVCSRSEAFGRVTVEALKLGKPVLGAAAGGTPELIQDGRTGWLYPPGDVPALTRLIEALDADRKTAVSMGALASKWAYEHFNLDRHGASLEAALHAAVTRAARA